ncbi:uncharacterized protein LOC119106340 [Pollicipes pollicipes]|uniref:uncharacterized protein LOC119105894 n=1 Tax=Pollicipes pollicipes TaxID=41117 RepID=UPI001885168A|nr:uncharacterized protein LOC119105894 [Pollicipes pollicipes]XP_037085854.1 uncharacterized protein LOC119106340 [Pollicipes pollicipes]
MTTPEFLPLCDVLFNIISLASYFCDVVFDVVTVYTLLTHDELVWFTLALIAVIVSLVTCQVCSMKWYLRSVRVGEASPSCPLPAVVAVHALQCGALWRYFKLFIPVDLRFVKQEVRDLCVLRMMHGFCQAAPMLLIQLYLIWRLLPLQQVTDLNVVSTVLSLFSVCWALASYNKNVRQHNMHKLVLTWLGVIFQLLWRLGTVTSRVLALTVYATLFHYWVFLVIGLHWLTMFLWLISPKNVFHGESITKAKKIVFAAAIAYVYTFCYINFQETKSRQKMVIFYSVMLLENTLLVSVWMAALPEQIVWYHYIILVTVFAAFIVGILFMMLYYQYFHINKLNYARSVVDKACAQCQGGTCSEHKPKENLYANLTTELGGRRSVPPPAAQPPPDYARLNGQHNHVIGVFNCRFNPHMMKRKKKKPTTFVPPPPVTVLPSVAFWRRPLPRPGAGSDHEGSTVSSRVNIQQKLQEKKQQQLAELRVIEEEIKQGKLARPRPAELYENRALRQPIPPQKRPPWIEPVGGPAARSRTPEVLLAPHFLHSRVYDEPDGWPAGRRAPDDDDDDEDDDEVTADPAGGGGGGGGRRRGRRGRLPDRAAVYKSCRVPSDVDSQISLPRSYTLPREFRYYRQTRRGKPVKPGQYVSSNSSDGDVDSENEADNETMLRNSMLLHQQAIRPRPYLPRRHGYTQHETQL